MNAIDERLARIARPGGIDYTLTAQALAAALLRARKNAEQSACGHDHGKVPCVAYDGCVDYCPRCRILVDPELAEVLDVS